MTVSHKRILLVADETDFCAAVREFLASSGYDVSVAHDGLTAWRLLESDCPDILVTDLELPALDGFTLCERVRATPGTHHLPVIVAAASAGIEEKRRAYGLDIDDFLAKPFQPLELQLRVNAVLRRAGGVDEASPATLVHIPEERTCFVPGLPGPVFLTKTENAMLAFLLARAGRLVSHSALKQRVMGLQVGSCPSSALRTLIHELRQKIEPTPERPRFLRTVHGQGYMIVRDGKPLARKAAAG